MTLCNMVYYYPIFFRRTLASRLLESLKSTAWTVKSLSGILGSFFSVGQLGGNWLFLECILHLQTCRQIFCICKIRVLWLKKLKNIYISDLPLERSVKIIKPFIYSVPMSSFKCPGGTNYRLVCDADGKCMYNERKVSHMSTLSS